MHYTVYCKIRTRTQSVRRQYRESTPNGSNRDPTAREYFPYNIFMILDL